MQKKKKGNDSILEIIFVSFKATHQKRTFLFYFICPRELIKFKSVSLKILIATSNIR